MVQLTLELGEAVARALTQGGEGRPRAVIVRDTRLSRAMLAQAVATGLADTGVGVKQVDILPTPGLAYLTASQNVDLGVMISASHDPTSDNGIKLFACDGFRLEDSTKGEIEALLGVEWDRPVDEDVGRVESAVETTDSVCIGHFVRSIDTELTGLRIIVDCANEAINVVAPEALRRAGADVVVISASPDGHNINDKRGSTYPEQLQSAVVTFGADFDFAFDDDADHCLTVDAPDTMVDGDQITGSLAIVIRDRGEFAGDMFAVTVTSNLGLVLVMCKGGITMVQTAVGDRYVLEAMCAGGYVLGGERSDRVTSLNHVTTGDDTLTTLLVAVGVARTGRSPADLTGVVQRLPQTFVNVAGVDKTRTETDEEVAAAVSSAEHALSEMGWMLPRPSGTEPFVRAMVEAATQEEADAVAANFAEVAKPRFSF